MFEALRSHWAIFGAAAIGLYVGAEVSIGSIMINFLNQPIGARRCRSRTRADISPISTGAARCADGLSGRRSSPGSARRGCSRGAGSSPALLCLTVLDAHGPVAGYAALAIGFFNSIMFPTIFTITLERSGVSQSSTSGLLCLAIFGGALLPIAVGTIADSFGLGASFAVPLAAYAFIAFFAVAARRSQGRERPHRRTGLMITLARCRSGCGCSAAALDPVHRQQLHLRSAIPTR